MIIGMSVPGRDPVATVPLKLFADIGEKWPSPNDVRTGVKYGPNGNDYTGTLTGGTGAVFMRRR